MWARITLLPLVAALAGGCANQPEWPAAWRRGPTTEPAAKRQDRATFEEAVALTANLCYDKAAEKFEEVLPRFEAGGDRKRASEAMFWLGYCREKQGRTDEARRLYRKLRLRYWRTPPAKQADRRLDALPEEK